MSQLPRSLRSDCGGMHRTASKIISPLLPKAVRHTLNDAPPNHSCIQRPPRYVLLSDGGARGYARITLRMACYFKLLPTWSAEQESPNSKIVLVALVREEMGSRLHTAPLRRCARKVGEDMFNTGSSHGFEPPLLIVLLPPLCCAPPLSATHPVEFDSATLGQLSWRVFNCPRRLGCIGRVRSSPLP